MTLDVIVIAGCMTAVFIYGMVYGIKSGMLMETFGRGERDEESPNNYTDSTSDRYK